MIPIEGQLIVDVMRREADSALPNAPMVDEAPRGPRLLRQALARSLRSVADWLEAPRYEEPALRPPPR